MDEVRRLAESKEYNIHLEYTVAAGSKRHHFTCNTPGCAHKKIITVDNAGSSRFVEQKGQHNHPVASSGGAAPLPPNAGFLVVGNDGVSNEANSPHPGEHATRKRRLASQNVSKVVQMFKSNSQSLSDGTRSPRHLKRGSEGNLRLASPASEAITPRSRLNPPTPSTASPPPAGGSGHTASTAVAADRLLGEEPISSEIKAAAGGVVPGGGDGRFPGRFVGYEGVNISDGRIRVTEHFTGGVVEGKPNEGKPRLALLFHGPENEYSDEYNWRKYGKKPIKGYHNPRFYWRCTYDGCGVQRHTQLLITGETEVLYDGSHNHDPPPARAARGRGRARVATEAPAATGRAIDATLAREVTCPRAASSGATTAGNSYGAATRAASSGAATGPRVVPAADDVAGPLVPDAAAPPPAAEQGHAHGAAAAKRSAMFMRQARLNAPTTAAMMGSPTAEDEDEPVPMKRARIAAPAAASGQRSTPAASPEAVPATMPEVARGLSPRPARRVNAAATVTAAPPPAAVQDVAVDHQDLPGDAQNLSRCPLYFLACVAAKEKFNGV